MHKANVRATKIHEQTFNRLELVRVHNANVRAADTLDERKIFMKRCATSRRKRVFSIDSRISACKSEVRNGPDFVCTC